MDELHVLEQCLTQRDVSNIFSVLNLLWIAGSTQPRCRETKTRSLLVQYHSAFPPGSIKQLATQIISRVKRAIQKSSSSNENEALTRALVTLKTTMIFEVL